MSVSPCAIVHQAEKGQCVYVDAQNHDCFVGLYHLGLITPAQAGSLICDGEYLTMEQGWFTPRGAKRNKEQSFTLPFGSVRAIAAAPLKDAPAEQPIDLLSVVTDSLHAMQLAGAVSVREGTMPRGELGPSTRSPFLRRRGSPRTPYSHWARVADVASMFWIRPRCLSFCRRIISNT